MMVPADVLPFALGEQAALEERDDPFSAMGAVRLDSSEGLVVREDEVALRFAARVAGRRATWMTNDPQPAVGVDLGPLASVRPVPAVPDPGAEQRDSVARIRPLRRCRTTSSPFSSSGSPSPTASKTHGSTGRWVQTTAPPAEAGRS